jgi:hypothetical protein
MTHIVGVMPVTGIASSAPSPVSVHGSELDRLIRYEAKRNHGWSVAGH